MPVESQELRVYRTAEEVEPFTNWYNGLKDKKARQIIRARLARVRLGNFGDCKSVGGGVLELRVMHGPGYRVYFGRDGQKVVLLLTGGEKGAQSRDIERAQEYWSDYRQERESNAY